MICKWCGVDDEQHCPGFAPEITMPFGCVCDDNLWEPPVPPACEKYVGQVDDGRTGYCRTCEHDEGCHAASR